MNGKEFEKLVKDSCTFQRMDFNRLKDAGIGLHNKGQRFTSKNICDCTISTEDNYYYVEIKKRVSSLRFDDITQYDDLVKKQAEIDKMNRIDIHCGVLVFFENTDTVWWVDILKLTDIMSTSKKVSFNSKDLLEEIGVLCKPLSWYVPEGKRVRRISMKDIEVLDPRKPIY